MIQQTQYTPTTPKYNFPHPKETLQLPQQLIELSLRSLKKPQHPKAEHTNTVPPETSLIRLTPDPIKTTIVATDVSSIRLGETETGIMLAARGAIVWKHDKRYSYLRLGPFPLHVNDKNKNEISTLLRSNPKSYGQESSILNAFYMQTRLTTLLERWIQAFANETIRNSLVLWDGSLAANTYETPPQATQQLLKEARNRQNTILAFSKMTQLFSNGHRITDLVWKYPPPCLLKIEDCSASISPMHLYGNVYVTRLSRGSCSFRLDVDKEIPEPQAIEAVQKLLGNEVILHSYPETLRLAHIFSTFTANEVLGMQRCIAKAGGVKIISRPNVRRLLFGCFGKGPEGS